MQASPARMTHSRSSVRRARVNEETKRNADGATPAHDTRVFWSSSAGRSMPAVMQRHGARALRPPYLIADPSPAVVFVDCASVEAGVEIEKLRVENGHEHYLIPVLPERSAERIVPLIARGANDVADELDLLDPEPIITRALDQTRLLSFSRDGAADFSTLQSHADGITSPVFFKDANGIYTGCNPVFEDFLGMDRSGILGKSVYDVAPSDLALTYHKADLDLASEGGIQIYTAGVRGPPGLVRMVRFYKGVVHDDSGRVTGIVGALHDIGNERGHEAARLEIEEVRRHANAWKGNGFGVRKRKRYRSARRRTEWVPSPLPARGSATDVENVRLTPPRFGAMSTRPIALLMMNTQAARP
jgi:PAS domain S-box-containing protein